MMKPLQLSDTALANEEQDNLAAIVYEDLIAEIKSTLESPFTSDAMKLKYIRQSFRNYDL